VVPFHTNSTLKPDVQSVGALPDRSSSATCTGARARFQCLPTVLTSNLIDGFSMCQMPLSHAMTAHLR
jgi:hypothetical protein